MRAATHVSIESAPSRSGWDRLRKFLASGALLMGCLGLFKLTLHLVTSTQYGYFRDELYFIDAGKHLASGYVDFPPFVALVAALVHVVLGESLPAIRVLPAAAGALVVILTGLMARELGGGPYTQALSALGSLFSLTFLVVDFFLSMNPFDELWWVLGAYILIRLLRNDRPRLWLLFGLVAGLGLLTKESMMP